jgi:serine/threonine-protein phosphatase PGAM5
MSQYFRSRRIAAWLLIVATGSYAAGPPAQAAQGDSAAAARTLYLVRHGAYVAEPKADPALGPGLTPLGIAQARLVAARLQGMPMRFDAIVSSPLTRARETAAVMRQTLADVPLSESPLLRECTPPALVELKVPSAEQSSCAEQLDRAVATLFIPAKGAERHEVLVAHGNVIRFLVTKALRVDPRTWPGMTIAHTSLTIIRVSPDGAMNVLGVGDIGHVPPNLQSWGGPADRQLALGNQP